uniref:uncharacterized protein LOC122590873 n=1 Tax=Erigeron canadensis TaxID=72917 RepID=UPI001CB906B9|nr:uncharacterized protein LOC122590873 [Erigeron canadensis]
MEFSTQQAWIDLRDNWPKVGWNKVVCFTQMVPKHAFILWLAIQGRLLTQDKIEKWQQDCNLKCPFCQEGADSHEHLFFQCHYSKKIWEHMRGMTQMVNIGTRMEDSVQEIGDKNVQNNISVIISKLVLAASVYNIWRERNLRIFKKEKRNEEELCRIIKDNVRFKLFALKVKMSKRVMEMAAIWNLRWSNNSLYAS